MISPNGVGLSPDETTRATLVEHKSSLIDRNFQIRLEDLVKANCIEMRPALTRGPAAGAPGAGGGITGYTISRQHGADRRASE